MSPNLQHSNVNFCSLWVLRNRDSGSNVLCCLYEYIVHSARDRLRFSYQMGRGFSPFLTCLYLLQILSWLERGWVCKSIPLFQILPLATPLLSIFCMVLSFWEDLLYSSFSKLPSLGFSIASLWTRKLLQGLFPVL